MVDFNSTRMRRIGLIFTGLFSAALLIASYTRKAPFTDGLMRNIIFAALR